MVIDLPSSSQTASRGSQNPVTQLASQRQETLQVALKALNIKAGDTITALVKSIHPVDDTLRARLIQQATPPSESANASANRNATAQEKLLASPNLKLVELEVQGKSVLVYTDKALRANQTLTLQQQGGQLIQLPDSKANQSHNSSHHPSHTPSYKTLFSAEATPLSTNNGQTGNGSNGQEIRPNVLTAQQLTTLQQALRTQLPQLAFTLGGQSSIGQGSIGQSGTGLGNTAPGNTVSESLLIAQLITNLIKQPGNQVLQQQLPRSLQESLQQLASHLRNPQQLSQADTLKQAIKGSGIQLEHQLTQRPNANAPAGQPSLPQTDLKAALLHTLNQLTRYNQPSTTSVSQTLPQSPQQPQSQQLSSQGQTFGLLATNPIVSAALAQTTGAMTSATVGAQGLMTLLQQLLPQFQRSNGSSKQTAGITGLEKLMQMVQLQVQQALGKILYLQLQSLQRSQPNSEGTRTAHIQLEIPINLGCGAQPLSLEIEEDWVTDYSKETDGPKEKVRQWQVKMTFDLPEAGSFHAHLTVMNQQVNASLWAENSTVFQTAQTALGNLRQQLEKDGCQVKNLECFHGKPTAESNMRLHHALVDIKT